MTIRIVPVIIDYTNYRGERSEREIIPHSWHYASNEWHPTEQYMLLAFDVAKDAYRWFVLSGIHSWREK